MRYELSVHLPIEPAPQKVALPVLGPVFQNMGEVVDAATLYDTLWHEVA